MKSIIKIKTIFTIAFLMFYTHSIQAQNYKILYEVKAKLGKDKKVVKENFLLCVNEHRSVFISNNKIVSDSLFKKYYKKISKANSNEIAMNANDPEMIVIDRYQPKIDFIVEKDFTKNKLRYQNKGFMSILQYTQKLPVLAWKLVDSTKIILNFKAQKATLYYKGRYYTAWYTTEIAVPEGPYKFWGLPGLILEIADSKNEYSFSIKGIEKSSFYPKKIFPKKMSLISLIKTTEKDYLNDFNNTYNANAVMGATAIIGQDPDEYARERVAKLKATRNNPIELE